MADEWNLSDERKKLFSLFIETGMDIDSFMDEILKQDREAVKRLEDLIGIPLLTIMESDDYDERVWKFKSLRKEILEIFGKDLI